MSVIQTRELRKEYGRIQALKGVSIKVEKGQIYGLLGQNGAGKTTLIKILMGIVKISSGGAELLGAPAGTTAVRQRVGYLPEDHQFPGYHTGYSLMDFYGQLYGVSRDDRRRLIPESLELVGMAGRMHSKIKTYSNGMKQRLGIAQAMLHDPEVIFLDEPTDGVDLLSAGREIRELMAKLKEKGHTIFLNSHLLGEVELICDRVAILQKGELVREGTIADLTQQKGLFELRLAPGQNFPENEVRALGFAVAFYDDLWEVTLKEGQTVDPILNLIFSKGLNLRHLVEKKYSLEEVFVSMVDAAEPGTDRRSRPAKRKTGRCDRAEVVIMQFIAFLKDSYREAKSGWMLQIMLVLAGLLLLLVASIGFRPSTMEDQLSEPLRLMTKFLAYNPPEYDRIGRPELSMDNITSSNKAEPWKADYTFDFVVTCPTPSDMRKARQSGLPTTRASIHAFLRQVS